MTETLKLMAQTADDLTVLSSLLQDAAVRVGDIAWLPLERRFALVGNRFRWEKKRRFFRPKGERVRTGLTLTGVLSAETNGLNLQNKGDVLDLLSVTAEAAGDDFVILFAFAGGATIRLTAECIEASLSDLGEAWEALSRPEHD
ncbi:DUF2948 family protein [Kordiimonas marina]|uniref:DUF2948 family protein n=1 Tax=Kordiimonas marina TaxID=2872312 RepID=UPI001FF30229|nr:DUF2948 family protein [Kordiimonas marina]MCJ9430512.1 DUF2948 family protein [Kordiimonas marina]